MAWRHIVVLCAAVLGHSTAARPQALDLRNLSGRSAGLAGAGSASVDDASAVVANPAMLSRLDRVAVELAARRVDRGPALFSIDGTFEATDLEEERTVAAAFVGWRAGGSDGRLGVGLGFHSPFESQTRWGLDFFRRFDTRVETIDIEEVSAAVAWRIGRWSFAAGPRYVSGDLERVTVMPVGSPIATGFRGEADVRAIADVSAWGWSVAVDHQRAAWGAALVARSKVDLRAESKGAEVELVDFFLADEGLREGALEVIEPQLEFLEGFDWPLAFDLPLELRVAFWAAPHPRLSLHLDLSHQEWSEVLSLTPRFNFRQRFPIPFPQQRAFDDTLAARLGAEISLSAAWRLYFGVADEESFVADRIVDVGLPSGDSRILAFGAGWEHGRFGIDAAFAEVDIDDLVEPAEVRDTTLSTDRSELTISLRLAF
ncbi:MAG TPA: outer membrane protein transport protein [Thermoanaerobaculia bacterium]|nr:outer membrane protein transport protein [Thermoanaerobaculia bacterium]